MKNENRSGNAVSGSNRWLNLKDISTMGLFQRERDVARRLQGSPGQFMTYNPVSFAGEWSVFRSL